MAFLSSTTLVRSAMILTQFKISKATILEIITSLISAEWTEQLSSDICSDFCKFMRLRHLYIMSHSSRVHVTKFHKIKEAVYIYKLLNLTTRERNETEARWSRRQRPYVIRTRRSAPVCSSTYINAWRMRACRRLSSATLLILINPLPHVLFIYGFRFLLSFWLKLECFPFGWHKST